MTAGMDQSQKHTMSYKRLLFMSDYPPSTLAGAPVIVKQLLRNYDMTRLDVLCCKAWYARATPLVRETYLDCPHTSVPSYRVVDPRPRRVFGPIMSSVDCLRFYRIMDAGRRLIHEKQIEAIFTAPHHCEFGMAAYHLHRELGLPLYVFITDDWEKGNPELLPNYLIRRHYADLVRSARKLWLTSPAMVRDFQQRFGVEGEFLFHFVDVDRYQQAARDAPTDRDSGKLKVVYTGALNTMFYDTMKVFCQLLNEGMCVGGRQVELTIYSSHRHTQLLGEHVFSGGFVKSDDIPDILAGADLLLIAVSFTQDPAIRKMVETSLYTKTVDYLASGRPVLVISPPYSGEVDYFGEATEVVTTVEREPIEGAIRRLVSDGEYAEALRRRGLELVRRRHSMESLAQIFLRHFEEKDEG